MIQKIKYLIDYFKYLDNPIEALKFKFNITDYCCVKIKNTNCTLMLTTKLGINQLMSKLSAVRKDKIKDYLNYIKQIDNNDEYLEIYKIKFINLYNSNFKIKHDYEVLAHLHEFFTDNALNIIDYSNRHVIDIGGNIGDTPLFFANKGATVLSFEPVPHLNNIAIENVNLNPSLKNKITLINKGIGNKRGKINFDSQSIKSYAIDNPTEIEVITIYDILNEYEFKPDILKMDCEGCEFEIILNNDLSMFNEIIFEHHSKMVNNDYKLLIRKLKSQGFKIKIFNSEGVGTKFEDQGMIYAFK